MLKKFNWLLFKKEDDPKYFSEAAEAKYNVKFQKEMDYKDLLDEILKSDEELKEAYQLKNEVTYFYGIYKSGWGYRSVFRFIWGWEEPVWGLPFQFHGAFIMDLYVLISMKGP